MHAHLQCSSHRSASQTETHTSKNNQPTMRVLVSLLNKEPFIYLSFFEITVESEYIYGNGDSDPFNKSVNRVDSFKPSDNIHQQKQDLKTVKNVPIPNRLNIQNFCITRRTRFCTSKKIHQLPNLDQEPLLKFCEISSSFCLVKISEKIIAVEIFIGCNIFARGLMKLILEFVLIKIIRDS